MLSIGAKNSVAQHQSNIQIPEASVQVHHIVNDLFHILHTCCRKWHAANRSVWATVFVEYDWLVWMKDIFNILEHSEILIWGTEVNEAYILACI